MRCGGVLLPFLTLPLSAQTVTFNKQIAPIVFERCAPCHRPGEIGPFPLLTYGDVRKHATQIAAVTRSRYMPPWPPAPGAGEFIGERRLSDTQLRLIADWVKQGSPEGDPADLPPTPHFVEGWQMGTPDLIVKMPAPYTIPASGIDVFRNFVLPVHLDRPVYVRSVELRPGNTRAIHHANIVIDRAGSLRKRDGVDGQPGFPGMDVITEGSSGTFDPDSHFLFWKPGSAPQPAPDNMSWRLEPGTDLILNLHLQATGKTETIQPVVGLYLSSTPPTLFPMLLQLEDDGALDIPAGSRTFTVADHLRLPVDVDLLAIYPHAHYVGKRIRAWANLPGGSRRSLIEIDDWDINWQAVYEYSKPVFLPKGTVVAMQITYDNSSQNPRNPNRPPVRVKGGNRSVDEMGHVWLQVLPRKAGVDNDPRLELQDSAMRRRLEKYPADFLAHYNLGALDQLRGKTDEAISLYRQALMVEPGSATAHNSLGAALFASNQLSEAITHFRETLRIDSGQLDARYNLARALAASQDLDGSATEFSEFLKSRPDDGDAHAALAVVLIAQRRLDEALAHLQAAARWKPDDAEIQTNLGTVLAMRGDLAGAITAFETALRLDPHQETARRNLALAQAQWKSRR